MERTHRRPRWTGRPGRRADGERGAALVEFVLILPLFLLVVFGGITAAMSYEHKAEVVTAVRDGARYGATVPLAQCDTVANCGNKNWAQLVQAVTQSRSDGALSTNQICVALVSGTGTVYTRTGGVYTTGTNSTFPATASSAQRSSFTITGGSGANLTGVFFTPEATPFKLAGGGNWGQQRAQFIASQLTVTGGGQLTMAPDPSFPTPPLKKGSLIR